MTDTIAFLVDTNVLVYAQDAADKLKQRRAQQVLREIIPARQAVLSVQCLTEFYRSVRWRIAEPVSHVDALARVQELCRTCRVLDITPAVVLDGCRGCDAYQMHFWDALIWATAKLNQVPYILSEDFSDRALIEGVRILDPFIGSFDVALLMA